MRAVCEACGAFQPPDWQAGDRCTTCGDAVRRELRCFWCAAWTPHGRFCRHCGAETVEAPLFGAARMLKDAGTDRFTVPKMLRELPPEQIENFGRIYQRQAAVAMRHVDDVRLCERHLRGRGWSAALEDELIPQLPWPTARAAELAPPVLPEDDDTGRLRVIHAGSPIPRTRMLAVLALLRLGEWQLWSEAVAALADGEVALRTEAALILGGWRAGLALGDGRVPRDRLRAALAGTDTRATRICLAWIGGDPSAVVPDDLDDPDPDTAFAAALLLPDRGRLRVALAGHDEDARIAAARVLIRLGERDGIDQVLSDGSDGQRHHVLRALDRERRGEPDLEAALLGILSGSEDLKLRELAARVLARGCRPGQAVRIAELGGDDRSIWQSLLQSPAVGSDDLAALGTWLVERGAFKAGLYGMSDAAKPGRMPVAFVPAVFDRAEARVRPELCRFAEMQLNHADDEALHRFLLHVVFGNHPAKLRGAAWGCLYRVYRRDDVRGEGPLRLAPDPIARFFGSVAAFVPRLTMVLRDHDTLKEVLLYDRIGHLLGYGDPAIGPALLACPRETHELVRALLAVLADGDLHPHLRSGAGKALLHVHHHDAWCGEVRTAAESLLAAKVGIYELAKLARAGDQPSA